MDTDAVINPMPYLPRSDVGSRSVSEPSLRASRSTPASIPTPSSAMMTRALPVRLPFGGSIHILTPVASASIQLSTRSATAASTLYPESRRLSSSRAGFGGLGTTADLGTEVDVLASASTPVG